MLWHSNPSTPRSKLPDMSYTHLTQDKRYQIAAHLKVGTSQQDIAPELIAKALNADDYFAHPYASSERGANENMNGLICQFFLKKMSFESIAPEDVAYAVNRLNHRLRKCLPRTRSS
ncbi:MAG: hypothetical protein JWN23_1718 [Rhodocyclales bacterium]|nr:hypothetical protein [Rhodocyclales bacterium]